MDQIKGRLQERGFKGLNGGLSSTLEQVMKSTEDRDHHDPRKKMDPKTKLAQGASARQKHRLTHVASKGITVNNQTHFKIHDFMHAGIVEKYNAKVAAHADAARKAALVAAATGESFSIEPVKNVPTVASVRKFQRPQKPLKPPTRKQQVDKPTKKILPRLSQESRHKELDKFDEVHQKILAHHRYTLAHGENELMSSHMSQAPEPEQQRHGSQSQGVRHSFRLSDPLTGVMDDPANPLDPMFHGGGQRRSSFMEDMNFDQNDYKSRNRVRRRKRKPKVNKVGATESTEKLDSGRKVKFLMRNTHFNETEITGLLKIFRILAQNQHAGEMDRRHFRSYFQTTFGITDDIMLDQLFHHFDEDNLGAIREHMWVKNLSTMVMGSMDEQVNFSYEVYDLNGDGSLGREEISAMLQGCIREFNGSGDDDGIPVMDSEIVEIILKKMDPSRIGYISKESFREAVLKDPTLIQAFGQVLPSSEKIRCFMVLISDAEWSRFKSNYSWPKELSFPKEHDRYDFENYKGIQQDPLRKQLAAVNRQIAKVSAYNKRSNQTVGPASKKPGLLPTTRSIKLTKKSAHK